jgi:hypothetical protein
MALFLVFSLNFVLAAHAVSRFKFLVVIAVALFKLLARL